MLWCPFICLHCAVHQCSIISMLAADCLSSWLSAWFRLVEQRKFTLFFLIKSKSISNNQQHSDWIHALSLFESTIAHSIILRKPKSSNFFSFRCVIHKNNQKQKKKKKSVPVAKGFHHVRPHRVLAQNNICTSDFSFWLHKP